MKKIILASGIFVFVTAASYAQQESKSPLTPVVKQTTTATSPVSVDSADFKFDAMEYNFGTINQGDAVNHDFTFTNTGKGPLMISDARGSCGCTVPDYPKQPIKKGEKAVIKVTFNSAGKSGMQDKTITINSNAKNSPHVLHIKGTVNVPAKKEEVAPATTPGSIPIDKK